MRFEQVLKAGWVSRVWAAGLVAAIGLTGFSGMAPAREPPPANASALVAELQKGGYVIFLRHALTEQTAATDETADLARCQTQRNLSEAGRAQAAAIGKSIKALKIPVGLVQASPFCRTQDTARLAFGKFAVHRDLFFVMNMAPGEVKVAVDSLRRMLATPPRAGTNTVLVSHSANLREAASIFAKPEGAAYVFRPLPGGRFEAVAKVLPEEWEAMARSPKKP